MKCEDVSNELIAYLDRRANSAERQEVEEHLVGCATCRTRAEEFRKLWTVLDEVPVLEPSAAFDARVRERIASEPQRRWFARLVPQPRLAFSVALLAVLTVWLAGRPQDRTAPFATAPTDEEQFQMIDHLGVLENFDVLTKSDVLSELPARPQSEEAPAQDETRPQGDGG
jgi:anti-sigma factor RsiW